MRKDILKLFYLPIILWVIVSIFYFVAVYFAVNNHVKSNYQLIKKLVMNEKKRNIKRDVEKFKKFFAMFSDSIYSYTQFELEELVNILIKHKINKLHINDTFIFGMIPKNKKFHYRIYKNRYILLNLKNKFYLVFLKNLGKNIYIFGIRKAYIDNFIMSRIIQYLDEINKNTQNYIALGKIVTLNPKKDGLFGYIFYMPPKLKQFEGIDLFANKSDIKGNFYRKKYLECFKENKGCFVSYYWVNPLSSKVEKKLSYFDYLKDYNLSIVKGIYENQISNELKSKIQREKDNALSIFITSVVIYFIILLIFIIFQYFVFGKLKNRMLREYEEIIDEIKRKTYYDDITGLKNRIKLREDLHKYRALLLLDIDDFSAINDIYGFEEGDKILKNIGIYLQNHYSNVYKIGSDEFAIGFEENIDEKFLEKFSNVGFEVDNIEIDFVVGASNFKEKLFETAEMALKLAIKLKNKKYVLYDERLFIEQKKKLSKINILKNVLQEKNIIPYYQCIVNSKGEITKYEALMRVKINNEIKTPYYFLDILKDARIYDEFSLLMIQKVFDDLKKFDVKVSINLSYEDINNKVITNYILDSLSNEIASKVVFEILESESIQNYEIVKEFISKVKAKGAEIAIDDFGSGYSNFVQVLNLEPDIIKIDASLIKEITNPKNYKMVELMVSFAKTFKLKTVAEFVSSKEIFDIVKNMGIDEFQGFYFCEPQPFDKISSKKGNNET